MQNYLYIEIYNLGVGKFYFILPIEKKDENFHKINIRKLNKRDHKKARIEFYTEMREICGKKALK